MKQLTVVSGKGGTGKTSLVGCFACLTRNKVMADCDVDAADLHLLFSSVKERASEFRGGKLAIIDEEKCSRCGLCQEVCQFGAISEFKVDPLECEGCSLCWRVCPEEAITMKTKLIGNWFICQTPQGPLVNARLEPGEENSGKLVSLVREKAQELAQKRGYDFILIDGSPGIGCPVIASLSGVDMALVVTEPTVSGMSDMERILGVCQHFAIPAIVCINKFDLNLTNSHKIEEYCAKQGCEVVGKIPFDIDFIKAQVAGKSIVEYSQGDVAAGVRELWKRISRTLTLNE